MTSKEQNDPISQLADGLVGKGRLLLTVDVSTREQADEIVRWMYSKENPPMKSTLVEVAWDKVAIDKFILDAVRTIQNSGK